MLAELESYDWQAVFTYDGGLWNEVGFAGPTNALIEDIKRDDVVEILVIREEDGDWGEWSGQMLARLSDGRFIFCGGWCDTTGWGCQDGTFRYVGPTFGAIARFAMSEEERTLFGVFI